MIPLPWATPAPASAWPPIEDLALLGDGQSAALVDQEGRVLWWCPERFDGPSCFARLLDLDGGHWSATPRELERSTRRYVEDTLVLERTVQARTGVAICTDALDLGLGRAHGIGHHVPHALVRRIEVVEGTVAFDLELVVRPGYGRDVPTLAATDDGLELRTPDLTLALRSPVRHEVHGAVARCSVQLDAGDVLDLELAVVAPPGTPAVARGGIAGTVEAWRSWAALHLDDDAPGRHGDPWHPLVRTSALVLQALTHGPTGAILAAPTTSLPEEIGGSANWDYRFAWLRDAAMTVQALDLVACSDEADRLLRWMADAVRRAGDQGAERILFALDGGDPPPERVVPHLRGYRGSAPVRIGNDAWRQRQLDVPGEVLDAAWSLRDHLPGLCDGPDLPGLLCELADVAARTWQRPDSGIWEGREGERHYTSSKVMGWVALDRAVRLADRLGPAARPDVWAAEAARVHADVLANAWHEGLGAYTGAYGSDHLDASVLLLPLVGFLPAGDERMRATIEVVAERLTDDAGFVVRWSGSDGELGDGEGSFVICSCWLVQCLAALGEVDRAERLLGDVAAAANDLGLLSEQIERRTGALLGNFPQGLSHIGIVNAAHAVDEARRARGRTGEDHRP